MILVTRIPTNFQLIRSHLGWYETSVHLQRHARVLHVQGVRLPGIRVTGEVPPRPISLITAAAAVCSVACSLLQDPKPIWAPFCAAAHASQRPSNRSR